MSAATHPGTYGFGDKKDAATQTKKDPARILLRAGFAFALLCLALNIKGVAVFFHRDKALERLVLSFVQECLDGQASILIIQPFGTHSDNEVV